MLFWVSCTRNEFISKFNQYSTETKLKREFEITSSNDLPIILIGKDKDNNQIKFRFFENILPEQLNAKIKQVIYLYNAQFEFTTAPYPGQITTATNCGTLYRPEFKNLKGLKYIKYFSNARLGLSICDSDEYKYYQYLFFLKNGKNRFIAVDYYSNKLIKDDQFQKLLNEIFEKPNLINYE